MLRPLLALGAIGLAACTPVSIYPPAIPGTDPGSYRAFYDAFPGALYAAHAEACTPPVEELVRVSRTEVRCELLLPPDVTAGVILEFDGTVEDLPRVVVSLDATRDGEGYIVTVDNYLRVPLQEGGVQLVRQRDAALDQLVGEMFATTGGLPIGQ